MANNIEQMRQNIGDLSKSTNTFANLFNSVSSRVTGNMGEMEAEFNKVRKEMNELQAEAGRMSKAFDMAASKGNTAAMENLITQYKSLDSQLNKLTPSINNSIKSMNKAFSQEFYTTGMETSLKNKIKELEETGKYFNTETNQVTDAYQKLQNKLRDMGSIGTENSLKTNLNSIVSELNNLRDASNNGFTLGEQLNKIRPDLDSFVSKFTKSVDQIETDMGRLTRFGQNRPEIEKSLGFTISKADIGNELASKTKDLSEYKDILKSYGGKDPDIEGKISNIEQVIKSLESSVGSKVKGYVDIFNRTNTLITSGTSNTKLIGGITSGELNKEQSKKFSTADYEKFTSAGGSNVLSGEFGKVNETVKQTADATGSLADKLNNIMSTSKIISNEKKAELTSEESLAGKVEQRKKTLEYIKSDLKQIAQTSLNANSGIGLNVANPAELAMLNSYKQSIDEAAVKVANLRQEQIDTANRMSNKQSLLSTSGLNINTDSFKEVKHILESPYKINIQNGTETYEKLKQIETEFKSIVADYGKINVDIVSDKDISDAEKIRALESEITKETRAQENSARAREGYTKSVERHNELQRQIAQGAKTVESYTYMMNKELESAVSNSEKLAINQKYAGKQTYKDGKYEGNNGLITGVNISNSTAKKELEKIENEFKKYGLAIPVKLDASGLKSGLSGDSLKQYLNYKAADKNAFKSTMSNSDAEVQRLSQDANNLGVNVDKILSRLNAAKGAVNSAFNSRNIEQMNSYMQEYNNLISQMRDKVSGAAKAQEIGAQRQIEAVKRLLAETKAYVAMQEALTGKKMSYADQINYYTQQLPKFARNSREYIEVLRLKRSAEENGAAAAKKAAESGIKSAQDSSNNVRNKVKQITSFINDAINKIISIIRNGISIIKKVFSGIGSIFTTTRSIIEKMMTLFSSFGNRVKQAFGMADTSAKGLTGSFNLLKGSAMELYAKVQLVTMAFNTMFNNKLVTQATQLYNTVYAMTNIMGNELTQNTIDWANKMEYAFGISAKQLLSDLSELNGVLYGLGMTGENVQVAGQNLLMVSRYLAFMGAAGGNVDVVMTKIVSGMKGMTQSIDDLGLSVREAQMDNFLKDLKAQGGEYANIGTAFASMNENARVYIRYAALIQQFAGKYGLENMANALDTVTGRISVMKQSFYNLGTMIGQVFVKLISSVAPFIIAIVNKIQSKIEGLVSLLGSITGINLNTSVTTDMNSAADGASQLASKLSGAADELDKVAESADTAKGSLAGFDKVTTVDSKASSSSDNKNSFDYSKLMTSALDNLNALAEKASESYADKMESKFNTKLASMKKELAHWIKEMSGRNTFDIEFDKEKAKKSLKGLLINLKDIIKYSGGFVISLGLKIADDLNIGKITNKILELAEAVSKFVAVLSEKLSPVLLRIYEDYIAPYVSKIGDAIADKMNKWTEAIRKATDAIAPFAEVLGLVLQKEPITLDEVIKINEFEEAHPKLFKFIQNIKDVVTNIGELKKTLTDGSVGTGESLGILGLIIGGKLGGAGGAAAGGIIGFMFGSAGSEQTKQVLGQLKDILKTLAEIFKELFDQLSEFVKQEVMPWLVEKLKELSQWLKDNKEQIKKFVDELGKFAWDTFKLFIDALAWIINLCVQHPNAVKSVLIGILALKVTSWFANGAFAIANFITQWRLAAQLKGLTAGAAGGGIFSRMARAIGNGARAVGTGIATGARSVGSLVGNSGVLAGQGLSTASGTVMASASIVAGLAMATKDAVNGVKKSTEWLGEEKGNTTAGKVASGAGAFIGGTGGGITDTETTTMGKVGEVAGNAAKWGLIGAGIGSIIPGVGTVIGGAIGAAAGAITGAIGGENIAKFFSGAWDGVKGAASATGTWVSDRFKDAGTLAGNAVTAIGTTASTAWENVKTGVSDAGTWIGDRFNDAGQAVSSVASNIGTYAGNAWSNIKTGVSDVGTWIGDRFNSAGQAVNNAASTIQSNVSAAWDNVKTGASNAGSWIGTTFENAKQGVSNAFSNLQTSAGNALNSIKNSASNAWSGILNSANSLKSNLSTVWENVKTSAGSMFDSIRSWASNAWGSVTSGLQSAWNTVTGRSTTTTTSYSVRSVPNIGRASGGTVGNGQVFVANENGIPELVGKFGNTAGVANNSTILEAMKAGIYESSYNALADVFSQMKSNKNGNGSGKIEVSGFGLIDETTLRKLAAMLGPYMSASNADYADLGFSLN